MKFKVGLPCEISSEFSLGDAATSTKLKDRVDRSPMNTLMSISQKHQFLATSSILEIPHENGPPELS